MARTDPDERDGPSDPESGGRGFNRANRAKRATPPANRAKRATPLAKPLVSMTPGRVSVGGGGLAGCEAAWQLARAGHPVRLFEMRPGKGTGAHTGDGLAELVCSNSLKSVEIHNAHGCLKAELELLGSLLMEAAKSCCVPAGSALAVDRELFSAEVERRLAGDPLVAG